MSYTVEDEIKLVNEPASMFIDEPTINVLHSEGLKNEFPVHGWHDLYIDDCYKIYLQMKKLLPSVSKYHMARYKCTMNTVSGLYGHLIEQDIFDKTKSAIAKAEGGTQ